MTVKKLTGISRWTGLSTDTKPTSVPVGSTFREHDTRFLWETYDGTNWKIKTIGSADGDWLFGEPTLFDAATGNATWSRASFVDSVAAYQKGHTGWVADLYGGDQTVTNNYSHAALYIPVNELPLPNLTDALWTYNHSAAAAYGVNMVIWAHLPTNNDYRVEITQAPSGATLEKASGWNAHELDTSVTQFWYYGEITGTPDTCPTAGTQYTLAQFQSDDIFSTYTIYRISYEFGWYNTGTFGSSWLADVRINGTRIPLKPDSGGTGRMGKRFYYTTSASADSTLAPKTPFRLLSIDCEIDTAGTTSESLTITKDSAIAATYDTLLYSVNTLTGSTTGSTITSLFVPFGEDYNFYASDEIDMLWGNTEARDFGFTWTYQTVFGGI